MVAFRSIVIAAFLTAGCSKSADTTDQHAAAAALQIAISYANAHYPKGTFQPDGARLGYYVEDSGATWKIDVQPVGYMGDGLQVLVRKHDMTVISALRTQ
ncbi:hypothetical protein ACFSCW_02745 [Sphingomonas tabacisoli]|uniref:NTF2 fold domain-containing protein n=1 Tax=Sphingomonas tabacisoli TaxID=2249466 RepID=A0ABW4I0Z7_9SPHN